MYYLLLFTSPTFKKDSLFILFESNAEVYLVSYFFNMKYEHINSNIKYFLLKHSDIIFENEELVDTINFALENYFDLFL